MCRPSRSQYAGIAELDLGGGARLFGLPGSEVLVQLVDLHPADGRRGVVVQVDHALERAVLVVELADIEKGQLFESFRDFFSRNAEFVSNLGLQPSNFMLHLNISQQTLCPLGAPQVSQRER